MQLLRKCAMHHFFAQHPSDDLLLSNFPLSKFPYVNPHRSSVESPSTATQNPSLSNTPNPQPQFYPLEPRRASTGARPGESASRENSIKPAVVAINLPAVRRIPTRRSLSVPRIDTRREQPRERDASDAAPRNKGSRPWLPGAISNIEGSRRGVSRVRDIESSRRPYP